MATETRERITPTDPERLSRLEGAYGHLATKADVAAVETGLTEKIAASEIRLTEKIAASESRIIKWTVGVVVSAFAAFASLVVAGFALLYRMIAALG